MRKLLVLIFSFAVLGVYADEKAACKAVTEFATAMKQKNYAKAYQYMYNKRGRYSRERFIQEAKNEMKPEILSAIASLRPISVEVDGNEAVMKCRMETVIEVKAKKVKGKWVIADMDL